MKSSSFILILGFFFLFSFSAWGFSTENTTRFDSSVPVTYTVVSPVDVIPVSIAVKKPLKEIQATYTVAESSRQRQRENYDSLRARLLNAPASEKELLLAQLSQQRQRVLLSTLNSLTVLYQRTDYVLAQFDETLLRLRSKYLSLKDKSSVPDFSSRMRALESTQSSLQNKSVQLSVRLASAPTSVSLGGEVVSLKNDLSSFIQETKSFVNDYRSLAREVIEAN
ncbi:MAG: hypothetical protein FJY86_03430 [Candidatus Diapherotrites archaeon]|uniref:Uncharacterized protein n=1 Tax=Candidatus Iainarchaeum sp. TaxID=3101447 RepID=A0A8T4CB55_9ARCH|nr:hypothetical protein [Candidatus Diapherotrites archaeon]